MKKLSISVLAVLAIVFAVSSAFTTNHKKFNTFRVVGVVTDAFMTSGAEVSDYTSNVQTTPDGDLYTGGQLSGSTDAQRLADFISSWETANSKDIQCNNADGSACIAYLDETVGGTSGVLATIDGDFDIVTP